jgi:hypothetical protein
MKKISVFVPYLAASAIVTVIILLIYVTVQQSYRSGANDPQLQVAKDIHARLQRGASIQKYFDDSINIESNAGVFTALYNRKSEPIQSSGFLDGKFPNLPAGVFDFVKTNGEERVTWQPRPGIRMATVVLYAGLPSIAYIVVGRSLQEVEIREHSLIEIVFICWVIAMAFIAIAAMVQALARMKQNSIV